MPKIVAVHSFLRGTGKSTVTANLAVLLAAQGQRVAVVDADVGSPALHLLFGVLNDTGCCLNNYLRGECDIVDTIRDVTPKLGGQVTGAVLLIPASDDVSELARAARESHSFDPFCQGSQELLVQLDLDVLLLDVPAGLNEASLSLIGLSDAAAIILRLDKQDYQGTSVTLEVARRLGVPRVMLVVNLAPLMYDPAEIKSRVMQTYDCELVAVLPHSDEIMALSSAAIFAVSHPNHPMTSLLRQIANGLTEGNRKAETFASACGLMADNEGWEGD